MTAPMLTHDELEVLAMLADDLTPVEIAGRLKVNTRTVHRRIAAASGRLGTSGPVAAVAAAIRRNLLPEHACPACGRS